MSKAQVKPKPADVDEDITPVKSSPAKFSLNRDYLKTFHAWIRIFIIIFQLGAWLSAATISSRTDNKDVQCAFGNFNGKNYLMTFKAIFLSFTIVGWALSICFLIFDLFNLKKIIKLLPIDKIATLSDFLYMLIMIGMVIVGFYGTELTNTDCEHINNGTPLAFAFATAFALLSLAFYLIIVCVSLRIKIWFFEINGYKESKDN